MVVIYRFLGMIARLSERLSHYRVNFVPMNLTLTVLLGLFSLGGLIMFVADLGNGDKPVSRTIAEVMQHTKTEQTWVTVEGELHSEKGIQEVRKGKSDSAEHVEQEYVLLLNAAHNGAILVQRAQAGPEDEKPAMTRITGILKEMDSDMQSTLQDKGGKVAGVPVDTKYLLAEGEKPGSPLFGAAVLIVSGPLFAAFILTWMMQYVVFQKTGVETPSLAATQAGLTPEQNIDLRVTGRFSLEGRTAKRFLNVRSGVANTGGGELALVSNIDASNKFMGFTTQKLAGLWTIVLQPDGIQKMELGQLYDGMQIRPAIRLRYIIRYNNNRSGNETAILSFANAAERETMLNELHRFTGYNMARG